MPAPVPESYVGRLVALKDHAFERIARGRHALDGLENRFIVAALDRSIHRLICYGANRRIAVAPRDIVLV